MVANMDDNYEFIQHIILMALLFVPAVMVIVLKKKKMLDTGTLCALIMLTGVVLRMIYTIGAGAPSQHDLGTIESGDGGHLVFIRYIYDNQILPIVDPTSVYQYYHPPLHHIICALWLRLLNLFGTAPEDGWNTLYYLTMFYSALFMVYAYRIFKELKLKKTALVCALSLVVFHPTLIILSGSLNNDMLSSLFAVMAIFYTIKWVRAGIISEIIKIALCVGLGMATKLSVGLLAPAIAAVFLVVLIKRRKELKKYIPQFLVFAVICLPLGLFWSVRCYVLYDMPLSYVPMLSTDPSSGDYYQYIDKSALQRLTDWSLYQFSSPFTQWGSARYGGAYVEFNPFIALLKNAMFDERTLYLQYFSLRLYCYGLFYVNIIIVAFTLVAMVIFLFIKRKIVTFENKLLLGIIFAVIFGNYIVFCINYPHVCTENMRYCVPLIVTGAAFVGVYIDYAKESKSKIYKGSVKALEVCTALFCLFSTVVYSAMMFY